MNLNAEPSRMNPPIRAVFFDFGGVVACLDHEEMRSIESRYGLPQGGLWRSMYQTEEWQALKTGRGTEEAWVGAIRRELDRMAGRPVAKEINEEWVKCWRGLDSQIMRLVEALKGRYAVGMISNATLTLEDELENHHRIHHHFEVIVNSARVGFAKPDARIFHHAAKAVRLEPTACLHIDDLPHNVTGARDARFHAAHYDGDFTKLEAELRALGLDW
jgi:putative hydrolase of the HAD superfamily